MVVEYNTEKKHTEYKIIVEDGRVSKIIVQIPKNEDVEEEEYEIKVIQPFDLFCFTSHVENCVVLTLKDNL